MPEEEPLTVDDLARVFFRAQKDDSAAFENVSADKATHLQFDAWARTRAQVEDRDPHWSLEERARFCDMLWQQDALVMLKKDVELNDGHE